MREFYYEVTTLTGSFGVQPRSGASVSRIPISWLTPPLPLLAMPVTSLKFNCVLFPGSQSNHNLDESIFSVSLPSTKIVDDLKDAIKAKRAPWFDQLAACELMLYKVSIPTNNNNLATVLEGLPFGSPDNRVQKLSSLSSLSTEFQGGVAVGHLHIVVKRPGRLDWLVTYALSS